MTGSTTLSTVDREATGLRPGAGAATLRSLLPLVIGLVAAIAIHFALPPVAGRYVARIVLDAGIAVILAVSLNIVNGMTGQFSIGHAGFFAVGGYTAAMVTYYGSLLIWGVPAKHGGWLGSGEWLFVAGCLAGGLMAAAAGYLVGLPTLRLRGDYLAIATLGFGEIIRVVLTQTNDVIETAAALHQSTARDWFPPPLGGALGFNGLPKYTSLFWVYVFAALTLIVAQRLKNSCAGRAMIAIREDEIAAQSMGVNVTRWKVRAFVIAAFFAGIAGGLFAHESGVIISPKDAGFQRSIEVVIMVVLGGKGSISGSALAAVLLSALPEFLRGFDQYRMIVYAIVLIAMMLLRPQGLFGSREIWDWIVKRQSRRESPLSN